MDSFVTKQKPTSKIPIFIAAIFVLAVCVGLGVYYFFPAPKHRERIPMSAELKDEIKKYFNEKGRSIASMTAYHCDSFITGDEVSATPGTEVQVVLDKQTQPDQPVDSSERKVWIRSGTPLSEHASISGSWPCQW